MKVLRSLRMPVSLMNKFDDLPITRSGAICQALINAGKDPELLVVALRYRMSRPDELNDCQVSYRLDPKLVRTQEDLSRMTKLSGEIVVRLCMEAYIHNL